MEESYRLTQEKGSMPSFTSRFPKRIQFRKLLHLFLLQASPGVLWFWVLHSKKDMDKLEGV